MSKSRRDFFMHLAVPFTLAVSACQATPEAEKVAFQFMEQYYVKIDPQSALPLSEGLAHEKIASQLNLMKDMGPAVFKPKVDLDLVSKPQETPEEASFVYRVKVNSKEVDPKQVFVKLRKDGDVWKVTQFTEAAAN